MKKIKVGIIGLGTVGEGVVKILRKNRGLIRRRLEAEVVPAAAAEINLRKARRIKSPPDLLTADARAVIDNPEIDIVAELIGGIEPAGSYIAAALKNGKTVVTANKALLASEGKALFRLARRRRRNIFFEASVGGGIPVIRALREGLAGDRITSLLGIINGTSNYVLTRMREDGLTLAAALKDAQKKGYAELDPTLDLGGGDSAHKLVILASLAFGGWVDLSRVYVEGIGEITHEDIVFTDELGYVIKLLAIAKRFRGEVEVRVHPTLIPKSYLLASVSGVFNAVYVQGDYSGKNIFYGEGAGQGPAASSVVSDIMAAAQGITSGCGYLPSSFANDDSLTVRPFGETECAHYIRIPAEDRPGVLGRVARILAAHDVSIASVIQRGRKKKGVVPVIFMTHQAREKSLAKACRLISGLKEIRGAPLRIRVEE